MSQLTDYPLHLLIGAVDCTSILDQGFTFSNVDPGGYESANFSIPRDMPETLVGQNVRLDCGVGVAWEGRVAQVQRSLGNRTAITCEGYGAKLKQQQAAMVFVDRDMSQWGSPSVQRNINLVNANFGFGSFETMADASSGQPSLHMYCQQPWAVIGHPNTEVQYDSQGIPIGSVYYAWKRGPTLNNTDTNWSWAVFLSTDDVFSAFDSSGELRAVGPGSGTLTATATRVFARPGFSYSAVAVNTNPNQQYDLYWTVLAVYGNHGLTKRGSNSATDAQGFYTSDIAEWVAAQVPTIQPGIIPDATGYIVKHASYKTPVLLEQMLVDQAKLIGCHWGVWEAPTIIGDTRPRLDFRPYPTTSTAWCYRKDCDTLDLNEQLAKLYDTAVVAYTDTTGVQRSVTVTMTNPLLQAAGMSGRTIPVNGGTMTPASAQSFGQLMLTLLLLQARVAGSATISGTISSTTGTIPAWMLKSGLDRLRIIDLPGGDAWGTYNDVPVTRVEASGSETGITTTVELGTGADLTETLQAQLAEQAQILGV